MAIAELRGRVRSLTAGERRQLVVSALSSKLTLDAFAAEHGLTTSALRRLIRRELAARLPKTSGALAGAVSQPAEIIRDRHGIPHVFAQSEVDAYAGLGFVVAQDRLWQLEYRRRWAYGTLAELLGPSALATDRAARTLRFDLLAQAEHAKHPVETRRILEAYAAGVNAAIAAFGDALPIEFDVLGIKPAPWSALDTVTIARASLWQFSGRIENVVIGEAAHQLLPPALAGRFLTVEAPEETILPPHPPIKSAPGGSDASIAWGAHGGRGKPRPYSVPVGARLASPATATPATTAPTNSDTEAPITATSTSAGRATGSRPRAARN